MFVRRFTLSELAEHARQRVPLDSAVPAPPKRPQRGPSLKLNGPRPDSPQPTEEALQRMRELVGEGLPLAVVRRRLGICRATLFEWMKRAGVKRPRPFAR